jgi:hypothetical protein
MENLFSTNLTIEGQNLPYKVVFEDDRYVFLSEDHASAYASFFFKRENDEWQSMDALPPEIRDQALEALEDFLLKQH